MTFHDHITATVLEVEKLFGTLEEKIKTEISILLHRHTQTVVNHAAITGQIDIPAPVTPVAPVAPVDLPPLAGPSA